MAGTRTLSFKITGDASEGIQAVGEMEQGVDVLGSVISGFAMAAGTKIQEFVTSSAGKLTGFAKESLGVFTDLVGETGKVMRLTGEDAVGASRLAQFAKMAGVDIEDLTTAIVKFNKNVASGNMDGSAASMKITAEEAEKLKENTEDLERAEQRLSDLRAIQATKKKLTLQDEFAMRDAVKAVADAQTELANATHIDIDAFQKLGIQTRDAEGKFLPFSEILANTADRFDNLGSAYEKTTEAQKLFGKGGASMLPLLAQGSEAIRDMGAEIDQYGHTLTEEEVAAGKALRKQERAWGQWGDAIKLAIGSALAGPAADLLKWMNERMPAAIFVLKLWLHEHKQDIQNFADKMKEGMTWLWEHVPVILYWITVGLTGMWNAAKKITDWWKENVGTWTDFKNGLTEVKNIAHDVMTNWHNMQNEFDLGATKIYQTIGPAWEGLGKIILWIKDSVIDPLFGSLQSVINKLNEISSSEIYKQLTNIAPGGAATGAEAANSGTWYGEVLAGLRRGATTGGPLGALLGFQGFDDGGFVPGPIGAERIVKVHGGEEIIPHHNPSAMAKRGGEMVQVTTVIQLDEKTIATAVTKHQKQQGTAGL